MFAHAKGILSKSLFFALIGSWLILFVAEGVLGLFRAWFEFRMRKAVKKPYKFFAAIRKKIGLLLVGLNAVLLLLYFFKKKSGKHDHCCC